MSGSVPRNLCSGCGSEWSGSKAGESVIVRGRNRADSLARRERVRRWRLSPTKRKCRLGSPFDLLSEANHLPAAAGASLRVSSSVADIRLTIFLPDPRVIIRQPERLECTKTIRLPATPDACARVAKGPPGMTSANQRWRPGARLSARPVFVLAGRQRA